MSVNRGTAGPEVALAGAGAGPGAAGGAGRDGENGEQPARVPLRELMDDRLLDALLERSKDAAGGLRLTGEGSMLGELVAAVLERALAAELTAHLGYDRHDRAGHHNPATSPTGTLPNTVQPGAGPQGL